MKEKKIKLALSLATLTIFASLAVPADPGWCMDAEDAPDEVTIDSMATLYGPVQFDHASHTSYARCVDCHHHTTGGEVTDPNCARCHAKSGEAETVSCSECHVSDPFAAKNLQTMEDPDLYHIDKPGLKGAYHLNCIGCHREVDGPIGCQDCHTMTEAGQKMFNTGKYAPAGGHKTEHGGQ